MKLKLLHEEGENEHKKLNEKLEPMERYVLSESACKEISRVHR